MILVTAKKDYADEFDVYFLKVFENKDWKEHLKQVKVYFDSHENVEVHFGTNEAVEYDNFSEYRNTFKVKEISDEQAKFIQDFIYPPHYNYFGNNILIEFDDDDEE